MQLTLFLQKNNSHIFSVQKEKKNNISKYYLRGVYEMSAPN